LISLISVISGKIAFTLPMRQGFHIGRLLLRATACLVPYNELSGCFINQGRNPAS